MSSQLSDLFERVSARVQKVIGAHANAQEATLALHVISAEVDFGASTVPLVTPSLSAQANFCGISIYRDDGILTIDKSVKYDRAAFVRLHYRFSGDTSFKEIAGAIYDREVAALRLLGLKV